MAVLPASKAYPRGGAPRRTYTPGAPLFAKMAMRFGGVDYARGAELPIEQMSKHKHWELWMCGKADHVMRGPFDRKREAVTEPAADVPKKRRARPAEPAAETSNATTDSLSDAELERLTRPE